MSSFDTTFQMEEEELKGRLRLGCLNTLIILANTPVDLPNKEKLIRIKIEEMIGKMVSETIKRKFKIE